MAINSSNSIYLTDVILNLCVGVRKLVIGKRLVVSEPVWELSDSILHLLKECI